MVTSSDVFPQGAALAGAAAVGPAGAVGVALAGPLPLAADALPLDAEARVAGPLGGPALALALRGRGRQVLQLVRAGGVPVVVLDARVHDGHAALVGLLLALLVLDDDDLVVGVADDAVVVDEVVAARREAEGEGEGGQDADFFHVFAFSQQGPCSQARALCLRQPQNGDTNLVIPHNQT